MVAYASSEITFHPPAQSSRLDYYSRVKRNINTWANAMVSTEIGGLPALTMAGQIKPYFLYFLACTPDYAMWRVWRGKGGAGDRKSWLSSLAIFGDALQFSSSHFPTGSSIIQQTHTV